MQLMHGDCLDVLRGMADNSIDSIVTDPPYGLSFMGKKWDYDVPAVDVWAECLRVLKPGGHLLAFAGTRTQHRMAVRIEDAGFEIRDMIAWVYGCLSEDTEILTENGWMLYNKAKQERVLAYDVQADVYQWERPSRWNEYRVESDTAYRIQSDHTDQIVSRGHRCIVERGGVLAFVPADELAGVERVPYLRGDFSALPQGRGELLLKAVLREGEGLAQETCGEWHGQEVPGEGVAKGEKPGVEGRRNLLQTQGEICRPVDQVRALPGTPDEHGTQRRVCDGASAGGCAGNWQATDAAGMRASHQPRCDGQQAGEPDAVCDQCGSQAVRARESYQTTVATVTAIEYSGLIWCPTVSTGAFVARRNGKVFITGNSGFPKSHDVSKAIDKAAGVAGGYGEKKPNVHSRGDHVLHEGWKRPWQDDPTAVDKSGREYLPGSEAAAQWQGWGTALKPALEPITVARKPLAGTVSANVLAWGTGALNIDGCRIGTESTRRPTGSNPMNPASGWNQNSMVNMLGGSDSGRWPANLIHDGSDEVLAGFPETLQADQRQRRDTYDSKRSGRCVNGGYVNPVETPVYNDTGSAARFFYCAKASAEDRDAGTTSDNHHPTVKPTDLMRYLVRLVTPPGGTALDPFMGSGSTGKAALLEGLRFVGIEREAEYIAIARARIEYAQALKASGAEKLQPATARDAHTVDLFA